MGSLEKSEYPGNTPGLFKKALEALCGQYRGGQGIKAELAAEWGPVMFGVPAGKFQSSYSATDFPGLSGVAPATSQGSCLSPAAFVPFSSSSSGGKSQFF